MAGTSIKIKSFIGASSSYAIQTWMAYDDGGI